MTRYGVFIGPSSVELRRFFQENRGAEVPNFVKISPFANRIAATSVKTLYLEQTFEHFANFFNETKQICASNTKRGGAKGFKFDIKST